MSRTVRVLLVFVAALGLFAERAAAQIPASDGTFYACVRIDRDGDEGKLARLVAANEPCRRNETRIHWSQTGPKGAPGTNGTNGAAGANGTSVTITGTFTGSAGGCSSGGVTLLDGSSHTTYYLCDGKNGADGKDGKDGVLGSLDQLAGLACTLPSGTTGTVSVNISASGVVALQCALLEKRVFVTSSSYSGNLGGAAGADASCQNLATAAGLGGTWKAWLSTSTENASTRLTHSAAPYRRVDGAPIAASWVQLASTSHLNGITTDEFGTTVSSSEVWTGTDANGVGFGGCSDFNSNNPGGSFPSVGLTDRTDAAWSNVYQQLCDRFARLYCIEQ